MPKGARLHQNKPFLNPFSMPKLANLKLTQPESEPILQVSNLHVLRDKVAILTHVSWRVNSGEHWVILGANGSGKTSLLAALTGYLMPTSGEMQLLGRIYGETDWRELKLQVGLVSSSIRQMMAEAEPAWITVASGRYAMIDYWGVPNAADRSKAKAILEFVECAHLADRPWAVLSQGERQRILIGRALMADPKLLILDEPCAGLDPVARERFLDFLERLAANTPGASPSWQTASAPALLLVTHHVEEIRPVFSHALLLKSGRVLASGPRTQVLNGPALSETFGAPMRLHHRNGRYRITLESDSGNGSF